jgi:hypothetical protein
MRPRRMMIALVGLSAAALLIGCTSQGAAGPAPADLLVTYEWYEGSLPPPYHYEYSIKLQADGAGEVTMIPDYPGEGVPVWSEPFSVSRPELNTLFGVMVAEGLFRENWQAMEAPPVGGSSEQLTVVAEGRTVKIPAFPIRTQQERAEAIIGALRDVVPTTIFADLEARRAAYEAEHEQP